MRKIFLLFFIVFQCNAFADDLDINNILQIVRENCSDISDDLQEMKKIAGINTAVTAVGTGTGIGAVATGIAKKNTDVKAENLEIRLKKLRKIEAENPTLTSFQDYKGMLNSLPDYMDADAVLAKYSSLTEAISEDQKRLDELTKKSENLGNWRTGLMAGTTATAVAGTAISATNKVDEDLETKVNNCINSVDKLREQIVIHKLNNEDVSYYQNIVDVCQDYKYIDLSVINKRATGALVSSAVATTTGVTGTILSAISNSKKIRDDNSESGKEKEKNLNTSSNVLAAGTTIASASSTVFNALQIKEIKKVIETAEKCSELLK
ncbi:MAG: hypothetical protein IKN73_03455 [Alphaproteobacteria bacterium]|nr:hypothetical protein [Alphaproteobacteria bacterium]